MYRYKAVPKRQLIKWVGAFGYGTGSFVNFTIHLPLCSNNTEPQ
jgi:hypothetical protein